MKWFVLVVVVIVLFLSCLGAVRYGEGQASRQAQVPKKDYVLQVDDQYLGRHQDCVVEPKVIGEWASVEVQTDPKLYCFKVELDNGGHEMVRNGRATITTTSDTSHVVMVYRKGHEDKIYSIHLIDLYPRS